MPTSSRLPPPRSPTTPSGRWNPETTPSAESRASRVPDKSSIGWPQASRAASRNAGPLVASRAAAVANTCSWGHLERPAQHPEPRERLQGTGHAVVVQPSRRGDVAAEAAQDLLVVDRCRSSRQTLVGDEADRVRADVDDRDRAPDLKPPGRLTVSRSVIGNHVHVLRREIDGTGLLRRAPTYDEKGAGQCLLGLSPSLSRFGLPLLPSPGIGFVVCCGRGSRHDLARNGGGHVGESSRRTLGEVFGRRSGLRAGLFDSLSRLADRLSRGLVVL